MAFRNLALIACLLAALTSCSGDKTGPDGTDATISAAPPPQQTEVAAAPSATIVTDQAGMTTYYHDNDPPSKSRCNASCENYWPPVRPWPNFQVSGKFKVIQRKDGSPQIAYDGRPLYTFIGDKKPGDALGDGAKGVWHVLRY